jgi:hypothetical protein
MGQVYFPTGARNLKPRKPFFHYWPSAVKGDTKSVILVEDELHFLYKEK